MAAIGGFLWLCVKSVLAGMELLVTTQERLKQFEEGAAIRDDKITSLESLVGEKSTQIANLNSSIVTLIAKDAEQQKEIDELRKQLAKAIQERDDALAELERIKLANRVV